MPKFRKKPVVVEAFRWHWAMGTMKEHGIFRKCGAYEIETPEGKHIVSDGDWIITGVKGEKYPCNDDIFRATYEGVDDEAKEALNQEV